MRHLSLKKKKVAGKNPTGEFSRAQQDLDLNVKFPPQNNFYFL